jgi:hypothetical protein
MRCTAKALRRGDNGIKKYQIALKKKEVAFTSRTTSFFFTP